MRTISGKTKLVGVLGSPVSHSLSPVMHNAAFKEMGLDWCYVGIPCEPKNLETIVTALHNMNFEGLNITIPHKETSIRLCKTISPIGNQIGAINTLIRLEKAGWKGENTDIEGFISGLKNKKWKEKTGMIIGCGGSARAVLAGLQELHFKRVVIVARNQDKLNRFIINANKYISLSKNQVINIIGIDDKNVDLIEYIRKSDLIVNTTPVGMSSNSSTEKMPLGEDVWNHLKPFTTLYDLIYAPRPTSWLNHGIKMKCEIIDGLEMLVEQGAASLRLWSHVQEIPTQTMKYAALNYLNS